MDTLWGELPIITRCTSQNHDNTVLSSLLRLLGSFKLDRVNGQFFVPVKLLQDGNLLKIGIQIL